MRKISEMKILKSALVVLIAAYVNSQEQIPRPQAPGDPVIYPEDYCAKIKDYEEFDFVVIGSGPAGSAVARRLAEIPTNQVLLLEAGGDPTPISDIPSEWTKLGPELRWNFQATRDQLTCQGTIGEACIFVPGKVLGGSSTVNAMMYVRGNKQDFEDWKNLGNIGWGYQDVLPYFKKLENFLALPIDSTVPVNQNNTESRMEASARATASVSSVYHSTGGPQNINSFPIDPRTHPIRLALYEAFEANGIPHNIDINGETQIGVTTIPGSIDSIGFRHSIAKAYLLNIPNNLKVCKNALVHKVNLNPLTKPMEVTSVKFVHNPKTSSSRGRTLQVKARKEYILSGGVYNSPGVLERSGIGIPKILQAAGVKPILTLNVGENFQDQYANAGSSFSFNYGTSVAFNPLTIDITSFTAFVNITDKINNVPDVQFLFQTYTPALGTGLAYKPDIKAQLDAVAAKQDIFAFGSAVLRQAKFGSIHITQSKNPLLSPKIVSNQLAGRSDIDITVKAARIARTIMSHEVLKPFNPKPFILNKCKAFVFNSEKEIMCGARTLSVVLYHHAGTCIMGPANNTNSVVDTELRVKGTKNLRVVDTSIMPLVTRGNTEMPAIMIGEKGADIIKRFWGQI